MPAGGDVLAPDAQRALEALAAEWSSAYELTWYLGLYCARRKDGSGKPSGPPLSAGTPGALQDQLRADWGEEP